MYIRTKDEVYDSEKSNDKYRLDMVFEKIIKQSENLEELCDGFYNDILGDGIFNFDGLYIYNDFENFIDDWFGYRTYDDWRGNGYGFIKTSKGLIYVAKMNENGELVLI